MRRECHSRDKRVNKVHELHRTCCTTKMQLIIKEALSEYSACIIVLPVVVPDELSKTLRSENGSCCLFWHISHQGLLLMGERDENWIGLLCASPQTPPPR